MKGNTANQDYEKGKAKAKALTQSLANQGAASNGVTNAPHSTQDNMERLREMLFGSRMNELDTKFEKLAGDTNRQIESLSRELTLKIDSVESLFKRELESISRSLAAKTESQAKARETDQKALTNTIEELSAKDTAISQALESFKQEINRSLHNEVKQMINHVGIVKEDISDEMSRINRILSESKVDKSVLSNLLGEVALGLGDASGAEHH